MSYNLVDPTTGDLTRVAGRGRAEYGASAVRSGTYIPAGSIQIQEDLDFSVTFDTPMPDSDYQVIFGSSSNSASSGTIQCAVRSRTPTGFTGIVRNVGNDPVSVASGTFTWFAFKLYSDVEYSNIVNSIPADASASNKLVTMDKVAQCVENKQPDAKTVSFELNSASWNCGTIYGNTNNGGNFKYDYYVTADHIELVKQDGYGTQGSITASLSGTTLTLTADGTTTIKTVTIIKS